MTGKVIEGRYAESDVYELPDMNTLFILTSDGKRIILCKTNVSKTKQFVINGKNVMEIEWRDGGISKIEFEIALKDNIPHQDALKEDMVQEENIAQSKQQESDKLREGIGGLLLIIILICLLGSCNQKGGSTYPFGFEACFRCNGSGMVNEGFLNLKTCPTCLGSGMLDSH